MLNEKVYILDYELLSPIATGASNVIESIRSNFSADRMIRQINLGETPFQRAAYIDEPLSRFYESEPDRAQHAFQYNRMLELIAACYGIGRERFEYYTSFFEPERTGVILGVGADFLSFESLENELIGLSQQASDPLIELLSGTIHTGSRINLLNNPLDLYSIYLASKFKASAFQKTILTACVSSTQAIAFGYDAIKSGQVEVCIVGGTDSLINTMAIISFGKLGIIEKSSDDHKSCKPFDVNRRGTLAGEAAGIAILVSENFLLKNDLSAKAELLGYGNTLDAYKITAPDPAGNMITRAIHDALVNAGLKPEQIDYINAHGTGTWQNDELELHCIRRALGEHALKIPVSSTKDRHGHAIAAAGIQELCVLLELMKHHTIPSNLNLEKPCDLNMDLVKENRSGDIRFALTNNFAFGGVNTVLALKNEMV